MKVTMKDIANKLGISINAVSIALNDKPGVSDEMRLEILKMADKMGYINQKRQYKIVKCPNCGQKLRLPRGQKKTIVTCKMCRFEFKERT